MSKIRKSHEHFSVKEFSFRNRINMEEKYNICQDTQLEHCKDFQELCLVSFFSDFVGFSIRLLMVLLCTVC